MDNEYDQVQALLFREYLVTADLILIKYGPMPTNNILILMMDPIRYININTSIIGSILIGPITFGSIMIV